MDELSTSLVDSARHLEGVWQDSAERWRDSAADYFEHNYWWPLAETVSAYIEALRALEVELAAIESLADIDYHT